MASNRQVSTKARPHISVFSLLAILAVSLATTAQAATYYVDQGNASASDSNPGTATAPWKSLMKATQTANAGDVVIVKAGRYVDPSGTWEHAFNPTNSGTALAPIVFRSEPRLAAVVAPVDYPTNRTMAFGIQSRNYITIDGFKGEGEIGVMANTGGVIQNCEVIYGSIQDTDNSLNWGITAHTSSQVTIKNNYVHNMHDSTNNSHNTAGIMTLASSNCTFENNDVDCGGGIVYSAYGQKGGQITNCVWRYNIARNGTTGFLGMGSTNNVNFSTDNQFYSNIIIGCSQSAFELDHNTKRFSIYNNVSYNTKVFLWADYNDPDNTNMSCWNNIVAVGDRAYHRETGSTTDWHALLDLSYYNNFNTPKIATWNWGSSAYTTLSGWTQATLFDPVSVNVAPGFVNAAAGDFHLTTSSPCRKVGLNGVDLGAYPFGNEVIGLDLQGAGGSGDSTVPSAVTDLRAR